MLNGMKDINSMQPIEFLPVCLSASRRAARGVLILKFIC